MALKIANAILIHTLREQIFQVARSHSSTLFYIFQASSRVPRDLKYKKQQHSKLISYMIDARVVHTKHWEFI